jgi:hypothetical protein
MPEAPQKDTDRRPQFPTKGTYTLRSEYAGYQVALPKAEKEPDLSPPDELIAAFGEAKAKRMIYKAIETRKAQNPLIPVENNDQDPTEKDGAIEQLTDKQRLDLTEVRTMLYTRTKLPEEARNNEVAWLVQNPDLIDYRKYLLSKTTTAAEKVRSASQPRTPTHRMHLPRRKASARV